MPKSKPKTESERESAEQGKLYAIADKALSDLAMREYPKRGRIYGSRALKALLALRG